MTGQEGRIPYAASQGAEATCRRSSQVPACDGIPGIGRDAQATRGGRPSAK